jgi:hypothetical protein
MNISLGNGVGFINPWTGEEMPGMAISDHDEDSLHGKKLVLYFVFVKLN